MNFLVAVTALALFLACSEPVRAGVNEWMSLGPFGGFIKALAIDPQNTRTMYAATHNGIFKSIDGAATWMPASVGLTGTLFSGLAIDPQDTNTLYAWGANRGFGGLFQSLDGAATWNAVTLPVRLTISAVAIGPGSSVYLSGTLFGQNYPSQYSTIILESFDEGTNWFALKLPDHFFAYRVAIDPRSTTTIYVAGYVYPASGDPTVGYWTVLKTTDAGVSWVEGARLDRPPVLHLILDPQTPNTLYIGTEGGIYRSSDGGASWNEANSGLPGGFRNTLALASDPGTPGTLYAVMGLVYNSVPLPQGVCCAPLPGRIFRSTDAGASWNEANSTIARGSGGLLRARPTEYLHHHGIDPLSFDTISDGDFGPLGVGLAIDPASPGTVYVGTNGDGVFKSTDAGKHWKAANAGLTGISMGTIAVDTQHPSTIYAAGWTRLFKSEDGGVTWRAGNWDAPALFVNSLAIDLQNPNTIYAGNPDSEYYFGGLFKSVDAGMNWNATSLTGTVLPSGKDCGGVENFALDLQNPNTLYARTTFCGLYKTTDQGGTWKQLDTLPAGVSLPIAIDPLHSDTIYAAGFVTGIPNTGGFRSQVYKSLDGGLNWTLSNSGLTDSDEISALLIAPSTPTTLYAGTVNRAGRGLYKSTDGAESWKRIGSSYPLAIDPHNPDILYADMNNPDGTRIGGVFRSTDGGVSWSNVSDGLRGFVSKLAFDQVNSNTVYVATSAGVFTITFVP